MEVSKLIHKLGTSCMTLGEVKELCQIEGTIDFATDIRIDRQLAEALKPFGIEFESWKWVTVYKDGFGKLVNLYDLFASKLLQGEIIKESDTYEVSVAFELLQEDQRACYEVSRMKSEEQGLG